MKYTKKLFDSIMDRHANGETLTSLAHKAQIDINTINAWSKLNSTNSERFLQARLSCAVAAANQSIDIADTELDPSRANVRMRARQWLASRYNRDMFGDNVQVNHTVSIDLKGAMEAARKRIEQAHLIEIEQIDIELIDQETAENP